MSAEHEAQVVHIVAKVFVSGGSSGGGGSGGSSSSGGSSGGAHRTKVGFPAYSEAKQLLGFFREGAAGNPGAALAFVPLAACKAEGHLSDEDVAEGAEALQTYLGNKSKSVFTKTRCDSVDDLKV